tara:strand:+ start:61 stop:1035 length:975 start_codon:yes stop_codon:yes gene_type:complete
MKNNKILITGATGFIGSHLAEFLTEKGFSVVAFDRYNINNDYGWLNKSKYKSDIEFILGDIRDYDSVINAMQGVDAVMHLAALCGIPYSYVSPMAYLRTNIEGTMNILNAGKTLNTPEIIITSTSETYGSAQYIPINEKHPLVGQSPYSASKISADQLAISYFRSFNLPIKIIRPFNAYGPRQSLRAVIPTIISQCLNSNVVKLGNLHTKRDFTYVLDLCSAFLEIKQNSEFGEITNVGMNQDITIDNLFNKIIKITNSKASIETELLRSRPTSSEVDVLLCDNSKILKTTNWKPQYNIDEGLNITVDWFKKYSKEIDINHYHI